MKITTKTIKRLEKAFAKAQVREEKSTRIYIDYVRKHGFSYLGVLPYTYREGLTNETQFVTWSGRGNLSSGQWRKDFIYPDVSNRTWNHLNRLELAILDAWEKASDLKWLLDDARNRYANTYGENLF